MIISLNELNIQKDLSFEYEVLKDNELDKRIKKLENSKVIGKIYLNSINEVVLNCDFEGTMYIEDSITLDIVPYKFKINIDETISSLEENYPNAYEKMKNTLDLKQILWQNIVLEVPMSFTKSKDISLKGRGWELVRGEVQKNEIDPRLQKLEDLLKGDD